MFHTTRRTRLTLSQLESRLTPATFVVVDPGDTNTGVGNAGDLRYCVDQANNTPGADLITFALSGSGTRTIILGPGSLQINDPVVIDGTTQSGYSSGAAPVVYIEQTNYPSSGIYVFAAGSRLQGLSLNTFGGVNVMPGADDCTIQTCFVGTNASGTEYTANGFVSIYYGQTVGGGLVDANVVAGSVTIESNNVDVTANKIGLKANGAALLDLGPLPQQPLGNGIALFGNNNDVADNVVSGRSTGVAVQGNNNTITGNLIGTNAAGTAALFNGDLVSGGAGIDVAGGVGTVIGGPNPAHRNLIAGHNDGVYVHGGGATQNTLIQHNLIGTNLAGNAVLGNQMNGVLLSGSSGNTITNNLLSGNGQGGTSTNVFAAVAVGGSSFLGNANGNTVQSNLIGTDATATNRLGNTGWGIALYGDALNNSIGGVGAGNLVAGSGDVGVYLDLFDATGNSTQGNFIGCNSAGNNANFGNDGGGLSAKNFTGQLVVGGTAVGAGNLVAYNGSTGIHASGANLVVRGNAVYGNVGPGVRVDYSGSVITGNSIHDNGGLGIDLEGDGVTVNDPGDFDAGANGLMNFPELIAVTPGSTTSIQGKFNGTPNATITLDFYASASADPSGYGEGGRFLGSTSIITDASGDATFGVVALGFSSASEKFTATATGAEGTSEFSLAKAAPGGSPATVASVVVNGGVAQRSRVTRVEVAFDQIVSLPAQPETAFQLQRQSDGKMPTLSAAIDNSGPGTVVTLTFSGATAVDDGSLADGVYTLTIDASMVSNANGNLDGDDNGSAGGDYTLVGDPAQAPRLYRFFGDINGDGFTDNLDFVQLRQANGSDTTSANWNPAFDSNDDGFIDNIDVLAFRQRIGQTP